ncbi:MAG TPA: helix-turn-helix transcriptional regulator [Dehalococcoidia bacterium]|nr:helix-turn-helix transcriptional regulator [Dehalococcoidia bacterium]
MAERDEVQIARWDAIRDRIGDGLREMRGRGRSQAQLAWELDELGFHISQSMVSRYEQGQGEVPLTLERIVGWALCCDALSSGHLREILELGGYHLPWTRGDMAQFDNLLGRYRALTRADQMVLRRRMLWHLLGLRPRARAESREAPL